MNLTWYDTENPVQLMKLMNDFTGDMFWTMTVIVYWLVLISYLNLRYKSRSLLVSSLLTCVYAIILNWMGLVGFQTVGLCIIGIIIGLFTK